MRLTNETRALNLFSALMKPRSCKRFKRYLRNATVTSLHTSSVCNFSFRICFHSLPTQMDFWLWESTCFCSHQSDGRTEHAKRERERRALILKLHKLIFLLHQLIVSFRSRFFGSCTWAKVFLNKLTRYFTFVKTGDRTAPFLFDTPPLLDPCSVNLHPRGHLHPSSQSLSLDEPVNWCLQKKHNFSSLLQNNHYFFLTHMLSEVIYRLRSSLNVIMIWRISKESSVTTFIKYSGYFTWTHQ